MFGLRLAACVTLLVLLTACGREVQPIQPTADEQRLIELLTMDRFIEIVEYERDAQSRLVVTTRQGDTRRRYICAPLPSGQLTIFRLDEERRLLVEDDGTKGTGPEPRGLP